MLVITVIGVVASLTIPDLITNTQDQQYKTAWKKDYSAFSQATNLILNDRGKNFLGMCAVLDNNCIINEYDKYLNSVKHCPKGDASCWHVRNGGTTKYLNGTIYGGWWSDNGGFILTEGAIVNIEWINPNCNDTANGGATPKCGFIYIDVNGFKTPNIIGKDIYELLILQDRVIPAPGRCWPGSTSVTNTGWGCSNATILNVNRMDN